MRQMRAAAVGILAGVALSLLLLSPAAARPVNRVLIAKAGYHDAYKISLTFVNGRKVKTIPAGTYTIVVHDYSKVHNFALGSVTANRRIFTGSIPGVGTRSYTLTLRRGTYAYACSAHPNVMNGTFVVVATP